MEGKQMTADKELKSQIESLRDKATVTKVLTYGSGAAMILRFITRLLPLAIAFLVLTLGSVK